MKMRASWVRNKHKITLEQVDVLPPRKDEVLVRSAWAALHSAKNVPHRPDPKWGKVLQNF